MRNVVRLALAFLVAMLAGPLAAHAQTRTRLVVYSTLEIENIADFKKGFEADNPDIEIVWRRDSTGVLTAKILADGPRQSADAIWGLAVTSMLQLDRRGMLEPYAPVNLSAVRPAFRDPATTPAWVGMEAWVAAVCFNTIEAAKHGLKPPGSWFDLTDAAWRGKLVMPHPASSGTGFFHVSAWIQLFGEEKAWAFMDALHKNIAIYEHSGTSRAARRRAASSSPVSPTSWRARL
jgi:iron(III) transport system substrate-binding protein